MAEGKYCKCGHRESEHKHGACTGQNSKDETGAVTDRVILCECKKFEAQTK